MTEKPYAPVTPADEGDPDTAERPDGPDAVRGPGGPDAAKGPGGPDAAQRPHRPAHRPDVIETPPPPAWVLAVKPDPPAPVRPGTLWAALATGLLCALFLDAGLGLNLLFVALPAALGAALAATAAGRRARPWTLVWAGGGLALLVVPALRDAGWPSFLAVTAALGLGSLALHGSRTWRGALLGCVGVLGAVLPGLGWGWQGVRDRAAGSRERWGPVVRTGGVAVGLLVVFGALFAGADAAFADLLGGLSPDVSVGDSPLRFFLFVLGVLGALAAARTAAAPLRWDRIESRPGRARGRVEWALPLVVLNALFAVFIAVQLTVLFGGYDKVLDTTGLTYSEYARQGFWQLLWATLLTLVVIAFAQRWAPRGTPRDRTLVRSVLGTLCVLTLVVVASALRRMDLYVDAYGLTRLRLSVTAVELWLGLVLVLIMIVGVTGGRWLPRAVVVSAAAGVLVFGLLSPDGLVAAKNVELYRAAQEKAGEAGEQESAAGSGRTGQGAEEIDLDYLRELSADAVPALDRLPEPQRSCALGSFEHDLAVGEPWYATSLGEARARDILEERPLLGAEACEEAGLYGYIREAY
ncbi:DUF4153 domain-containing protein [Streptomyces lycii]|uniref:DUF4153 domain-containing protein n=1 Tax=Streptomyces lycii TaxID=2654337 RepID=UPI002E252FBB